MPADPHLISRSATHKAALLDFIKKPRYRRALAQLLDATFGDDEPTEGELINTHDYFMLEYRFPNGRTVIDDYLKAHPRLPADEREMLLGWKEVIEVILRAERVDGEALIATNLVDDLTYRVRANTGPQFFDRVLPGSFLEARLTPLQDEWLLSGASAFLPKSDSFRAYSKAEGIQGLRPELVFRNPAKVEQGWTLQRQEREHFINFFGADLIVLPRGELTERYEAYLYSKVDPDDPDVLEDEDGLYNPAFDTILDVLDELADQDIATFGLVYDEVEGFGLLPDFALFEEAFANPDLVEAASGLHRKVLRAYLRDPLISPLSFHRMVERYPDNADRTLQALLRKPSFSWQRDGEGLMRRHKKDFFATTPLPKVIPTLTLPNPGPGTSEGRERLTDMQDAVWKERD